jgi:hypothetical protein
MNSFFIKLRGDSAELPPKPSHRNVALALIPTRRSPNRATSLSATS